ncbi:MAG: hypothetical protein Ct9H300mP1_24640 [Planctomycetaceae bacterium]|nr:MAG: hypothetical protein Ct9H300mP1_24640 [Planctomycetaceae bacterium]
MNRVQLSLLCGADVAIVGEDCLGGRVLPRFFHQVVVVDFCFLVTTTASTEKAKQGSRFGGRFDRWFGSNFWIGVYRNAVGRIDSRMLSSKASVSIGCQVQDRSPNPGLRFRVRHLQGVFGGKFVR